MSKVPKANWTGNCRPKPQRESRARTSSSSAKWPPNSATSTHRSLTKARASNTPAKKSSARKARPFSNRARLRPDPPKHAAREKEKTPPAPQMAHPPESVGHLRVSPHVSQLYQRTHLRPVHQRCPRRHLGLRLHTTQIDSRSRAAGRQCRERQ